MKKKSILISVIFTFFLTIILVCIVFFAIFGKGGVSLLQTMSIIRFGYVGEYDIDDEYHSAINGMVTGIGDRWSRYLDKEAYDALKKTRSNSYTGIGVTIGYSDPKGLKIERVEPNGPADKAGVKTGYILISVDGISASDSIGQEEVLLHIRESKIGDVLECIFLTTDEKTVSCYIEVMNIDSKIVEYSVIAENIGYVKFNNFYTGSATKVKSAVEDLQSQGVHSIIFDVRYNPGGYVSELTELLDFLLPEGDIFQTKTKYGKMRTVKSDAANVDMKFVVLVNENTYSAAEFFAAQLQESVYAPVVGTRTCGKGYSQETFDLANGGAVLISTGKYFSGKGVCLIDVGVELDEEIALSPEKEIMLKNGVLEWDFDDQLLAAIKILK